MQMGSQMQVTIPAGVGEGQNFLVQTPAGGQMQVTVPAGAAAGSTIMISVPEASAVPVAFGQAAGTPGNDWLLQHKGLYVRQHLEVIEIMTDCETKNRYSFTPIPVGTTIPDAPDSGWSEQYRNQAGFNPLLKGKEESECFERICCPLFRGFDMALKDGTGTPFVTFHRPFKCDPCYAPPCCSCVNQEMSMDAAGQPVTSAKEVTGMCCTTGCCNRKFETYDASGKLMYTMEINDCNSKSGGTNLCAPTCFNEALTVDVTDANGNLLPPSTFVWPGCNCGGLTDLTNMVVQFPDGTTAAERSSILTGMMLIEFTVMEQRRQNNKNNNGAGGGAPPNKEMAR